MSKLETYQGEKKTEIPGKNISLKRNKSVCPYVTKYARIVLHKWN